MAPYEGKVAFSTNRHLMNGLVFENKDVEYGVCVVAGFEKQVVFDGFVIVEPKSKNEVVIKASCGQEMAMELGNIDKDQPISKVVIRGVEYTPS